MSDSRSTAFDAAKNGLIESRNALGKATYKCPDCSTGLVQASALNHVAGGDLCQRSAAGNRAAFAEEKRWKHYEPEYA